MGTKIPVLSVYDEAGNRIPIPAIRGKSAYSYAQDGGYTGTEEDFAKKLAQDVPEGGGAGGDTWRLVADVLLTEDTATIDITQDTAGNAFALKEYRLIGYVIGAAENTKAGSVYANALSKNGFSNRIAYASQSAPVNGGKKTISFYGKVCGKRLLCIFGNSGDGTSETNAQMYTMIDNTALTFQNREFDAIKNISLTTNVAGYGLGTRLELWGVDA
jgi:hypothetical protein